MVGANDHQLVTVVLAGDQVSSRAAVRTGLECHRFTVVAEADDADEAVEAALRCQPQVCVLDVDTPGGGIAAANRIHADLPGIKIAMLSGSSSREELRDAILAGADAYLLRSTAPDRLAEALHALVNGEAAVPRALTVDLLSELRATAEPTSATARSRPISAARNGSHFTLVSHEQPQSRSSLRYVPRLLRHFRRRVRSGMRLGDAWSSARQRMSDYE
jgi:DNA-binding NarL/FixJ family response regulator